MRKTLFIVSVFLVAVFAGLFLSGGSPKSRETFAQKSVGAPVSGTGMGPYDGLSVGGVASGWMNNETVPNGSSPLSSGSPQLNLANNNVSPSCCPSSISTDRGCMCLSDDDKHLFASRGGNRGMGVI